MSKKKFDLTTTQGLLGSWRESAARVTGKKQEDKPLLAHQIPPAGSGIKTVMGGSTTSELLDAWRAATAPKKPVKRKALREKVEKVREFDPETAAEAEKQLDALDAADDDAADEEAGDSA